MTHEPCRCDAGVGECEFRLLRTEAAQDIYMSIDIYGEYATARATASDQRKVTLNFVISGKAPCDCGPLYRTFSASNYRITLPPPPSCPGRSMLCVYQIRSPTTMQITVERYTGNLASVTEPSRMIIFDGIWNDNNQSAVVAG